MKKILIILLLFFISAGALLYAETTGTDTAVNPNNNNPVVLTQSESLDVYLKAWIDEKYEIMYEMVDDNLKEEMPYKDFESILKKEKKDTGGLKAFDLKSSKTKDSWDVTLFYNKNSYRPKTVNVFLQSYKNSWLITGGGLTPQDMSIFDR